MTANEGASPNALKHAHSTAMSKPHHISAPTRPALPVRSRRRASRTPWPIGAITRRTRPSPGLTHWAAATAAITAPPKMAGTIGDGERAAAGQQAGVEADAADHERAHVDAVEQDEEGDHARGDVGALHAGAAHRPRGQRDPAGAGAGEQPRRGVAGEVDLGAGPQADPRAAVLGDRAEQDDVAEEGEHLEDERQHQPVHVAALQPLPRLGEVGEGRARAARASPA